MDRKNIDFLGVLASNEWNEANAALPFILGVDADGKLVIKDFAALPHLLIAGATGTGKSTLTHAIILSLIDKQPPESINLLLCDTKILEFSGYRDLPHLLCPVVTDLRKISRVLVWLNEEIRKRALALQEVGIRSISSYNAAAANTCKEKMQHIVVVLDDAAVLAEDSTASALLLRILENGRSVGVHLILITQSPASKNITEHIKAIPARAVFNVFTNTEEKLLLGASKNKHLSDVGEIIFRNFLTQEMQRLKCFTINDNDISAIVSKANSLYGCSQKCLKEIVGEALPAPQDSTNAAESDEMLPAAVDAVLETGQASVSMLQRRLKLGYARAARIVDEMEEMGIVGPFRGSMPRDILVTREQWQAMRNGGFDGELDSVPNTINEPPADETTVSEAIDMAERQQDKPKPIRGLKKFFRKVHS